MERHAPLQMVLQMGNWDGIKPTPISGAIIKFFELVGAHLVVIHRKTGEYSKKANLPTGSMYMVYLPIYFP